MRQNPGTERIKIFIMFVDPQHRYSDKAERAYQDIYDNLRLKITF